MPNEVVNFDTLYLTENSLEILYTSLHDFMKRFGCYYLAYVFEDLEKGVRIGFSSNTDWQNQYIGNHLIEQCHLWQSARELFVNTKLPFLALPWDYTQPKTSQQKDIYLFRRDFFIGNEISFCSQTSSKREYLALCPDTAEKNFLTNALNNSELIKKNLSLIRKEAARTLKIG